MLYLRREHATTGESYMGTTTHGGGIEPQEIHDILRNKRRRNVLKELRSSGGSVSVRDLSERIAEREAGESPAPRNLRESVYNSLHQTHLPKLDERAVVDYDKDRKTVELLEGARQVDIYMEVVTEYGLSWATYYRSLTVVALLVVVASELGAPGISVLPTLAWTTIGLGVLGLSTAYQLWSRRWFYLQPLLNRT
jgi:hypothetical protein